MNKTSNIFFVLFYITAKYSFSTHDHLFAQTPGRYYDFTIELGSKRAIAQSYDKNLSRYELFFKDTTFEELKSLHETTHPFIRNIIIRESPGVGTNVWLVLQDSSLISTIDIYEQPFRVRVAIHDSDYKRQRNTATQLPSQPKLNQYQAPTSVKGKVHNLDRSASNPTSKSLAKSKKTDSSNKGNYQLLKPQSNKKSLSLIEPDLAALAKIPTGRGTAWKSYPAYMYPLNITSYLQVSQVKRREKKDKYYDLGQKAVELYRAGHEHQALYLLDRMLSEEPHQFAREPVYLWVIAECHLSLANLALARGYYQSLKNRFPDSELKHFANIRILDLDSIAKIQSGKNLSSMNSHLPNLDHMLQTSNHELRLLANIRFAYWGKINNFSPNRNSLARLNPKQPSLNLYKFANQAQTKKTKLLAASLPMYEMCSQANFEINNLATHLKHYISAFDHKSNPFLNQIRIVCEKRLSKFFKSFENKTYYSNATKVWENLPEISKNKISNHNIQWYLAEGYRQSDNPLAANKHYLAAYTDGQKPIHDFLTIFYRLDHLVDTVEGYHPLERQKSKEKLTSLDRRLEKEWGKMSSTHQAKLMKQLYPYFQNYLKGDLELSSVSNIVLQGWKKSLQPQSDENKSEQNSGFTPGSHGVEELITISKWFAKFGKNNQRIESLELLKELKPELYQDNQTTAKIWADQLLQLAEEFRKENAYLSAGRTFIHVASNAPNLDERAESFYKGGLLLYRAGKREEAIQALTRASQDGDNLFYANLAKQRLTKLQ